MKMITERFINVMTLLNSEDFSAPKDTIHEMTNAKAMARKSGKLPSAGTFHLAMSSMKKLYIEPWTKELIYSLHARAKLAAAIIYSKIMFQPTKNAQNSPTVA